MNAASFKLAVALPARYPADEPPTVEVEVTPADDCSRWADLVAELTLGLGEVVSENQGCVCVMQVAQFALDWVAAQRSKTNPAVHIKRAPDSLKNCLR